MAAATLLVAVALVGCGGGGGKDDAAPAATESVPATSTAPAPWPAPDQAVNRIRAAGLPPLDNEQLAFHKHAKLVVFVDGKEVPVAAGIGIDVDAKKISPLHTHAADGILHMEAARPTRFTLGQVFTEWGVRLDDRCVGAYCSPDEPVRVFVDGKEHTTGAVRDIQLADGQVIIIAVGDLPTNG